MPRCATPFIICKSWKQACGLATSRASGDFARAGRVGVGDALEVVRRVGQPLVREDGVGRSHLLKRDLEGAEGHGGPGVQTLVDAQPLGGIDHVVPADELGKTDGGDVVRILERAAQGHDAAVAAVIVRRAVRLLPRVVHDGDGPVETVSEGV